METFVTVNNVYILHLKKCHFVELYHFLFTRDISLFCYLINFSFLHRLN